MVIAAIIGIILLTILIVWLIDKFVPRKLKPIINLVLWALIIFLGYITFMSVYKEIQFNQLKVERYKVVIDRLVDIRDSQLAYKEVNGEYAGSFDKLINFIENDSIPITQRRDSTVLDVERTRAFGGVETFKTITIIDTLDYWNVKDSIFKGDKRYKNLAKVGVGKEDAKFKLQAGKLEDIPVFEASVDKSIVLDGQEKYLIEKERQAVSIAGVKGASVKIGSMEEVNTSGNWGKDLSVKE
ncbi:hypothetical protein BWZ20_01370 [Winogradskyella sp. J14-2]|uniref:hypothetical protein n=1 Tax=Winogradskyella sp. J14-2 TaxID=1936080 RepID=UPI000972C7F8|nr:hypothetical protein [Winogradskyella sp. J14-2]APY07030.1 hypothetical protein BWZ20_01370 [Winogradskyella sp. J14-2]